MLLFFRRPGRAGIEVVFNDPPMSEERHDGDRLLAMPEFTRDINNILDRRGDVEARRGGLSYLGGEEQRSSRA